MEKIVEIKNLNKRYGKKEVLKDINLELKKGQIIGLLGPNGSGKSTLTKILSGMNANYKGEVFIDGNKIGEKTKSVVSYLPDNLRFPDYMKVKDTLNLYKEMFDDFNREKAEKILDRFSIDLDMKIKTMSKGTAEKLQIALVMSREAKLIILDEPIGGIDPSARDVIMEVILSNFNENQTILLATHLIADIEKIFDSVIFIKNGEIVLNEEVEILRSKYNKSVLDIFKEVFVC